MNSQIFNRKCKFGRNLMVLIKKYEAQIAGILRTVSCWNLMNSQIFNRKCKFGRNLLVLIKKYEAQIAGILRTVSCWNLMNSQIFNQKCKFGRNLLVLIKKRGSNRRNIKNSFMNPISFCVSYKNFTEKECLSKSMLDWVIRPWGASVVTLLGPAVIHWQTKRHNKKMNSQTIKESVTQRHTRDSQTDRQTSGHLKLSKKGRPSQKNVATARWELLAQGDKKPENPENLKDIHSFFIRNYLNFEPSKLF
jgi:hypothetical protein